MPVRWIDELNRLYRKIVNDPQISVENLDKANEIITETIEKLRPLTMCKVAPKIIKEIKASKLAEGSL